MNYTKQLSSLCVPLIIMGRECLISLHKVPLHGIDVFLFQSFLFGQRPQQGTKSCKMGRNSVCLSIRPSIRPPLAGPQTLLAGLQTLLTGPQTLRASWRGLRARQQGLRASHMDKWMDGRTNRISPHFTGLCPLSGPLPCYFLRLHNIKEAGQGNC